MPSPSLLHYFLTSEMEFRVGVCSTPVSYVGGFGFKSWRGREISWELFYLSFSPSNRSRNSASNLATAASFYAFRILLSTDRLIQR